MTTLQLLPLAAAASTKQKVRNTRHQDMASITVNSDTKNSSVLQVSTAVKPCTTLCPFTNNPLMTKHIHTAQHSNKPVPKSANTTTVYCLSFVCHTNYIRSGLTQQQRGHFCISTIRPMVNEDEYL